MASWEISWPEELRDCLKGGACGVEKQGGRLNAVVSEGPAVREWCMGFQEMIEAAGESAFHIGLRNGMPAHFDSLGNAAKSENRGWNPEVMDFDMVTEGFGPLKEADVGRAAEGAFEAEGYTGFQTVLDFAKQKFACFDGEFLRIEWGETAGDFVGVEETGYGIKLAEIGPGEGGLARAVGTGEEEERGP